MTQRSFHPDSRISIEPLAPSKGGGSEAGLEAFDCDDAEVWVEADSLLVSYFDDQGMVVLEGRRDGAGGWTITGRSRPRRGRLVPRAGASDHWIGELEEQGARGRWSLRLGAPVAGTPTEDGETCPKNR